MAPSRRRSTRGKAAAPANREASAQASDSSALSDPPPEPERNDKDTCPSCTEQPHVPRAGEKDTWIQCNGCKTWFHWRCVGEGGDYESLEKWYCQPCRAANPSLKPTVKPPARKSTRKRTQLDYANLHAGLDAATNGSKWIRVIETKDIKPDAFKRMKGSDLTLEWLEHDAEAFKEPIVVLKPDGLGMRMPEKGFTVSDVSEIVGPLTPVEVIDVSTQSNSPNWNLAKWSEYYSLAPESRDKIRNVISLEFSNTPLADKVSPPRIVRELDWVEKFWPANKKGNGQLWPKVQMYCLMGVAHAWTDWHVDFAGSSVYYHIFRGSKIFYFIRPTAANLAAYERWSGTDLQNSTWLGDLVDEVVKVELVEGNTMIIPTGWIHAVHTPIDSLVFGGNFLHSWNIGTQLRVREIEIATHVPKKFRFPLFIRLCWYAGEKYLRDLKAREDFPPRVLDSLAALADFLVDEARIIEGRSSAPGTAGPLEAARKESKDAVPIDKVKDAPALARELRWRVRNARGAGSGDEGVSAKRAKSASKEANGNGVKRKRDSVDLGENENGRQIFRNWKRRAWDREEMLPKKVETKVVQRRFPMGEEDLGTWVHDGADADDEMEQDHDAHLETTMEVMIKVRRIRPGDTEEVVERQRIERTSELFRWPKRKRNVEPKGETQNPSLVEDQQDPDLEGNVPETKAEPAPIVVDA